MEGAAAAAWDGKVYLVGGDDDFAPSTGVSDRVDVYDVVADAWELGPALGSPRADLALAATAQALCAIAGDQNGGWLFEPTYYLPIAFKGYQP